MNEPLWVDVEALRVSSTELEHLTVEVSRMVADLMDDLAREGEFWGDDEPGRMIAESYVPGAEQAQEGMRNLVADLRAMRSHLADAANAFEYQDVSGGRHIDDTANPSAQAADPGIFGRGSLPIPYPEPAVPAAGPQGGEPISNLRRSDTPDRPDTPDTSEQSPSPPPPTPQSSYPPSDTPIATDFSGQDMREDRAPTAGTDAAVDTSGRGATAPTPNDPTTSATDPAANTSEPGHRDPVMNTSTPGTTGPVAAPSANLTNPAANRTNPVPTGPAVHAIGPTTATPWSGSPAGTPWSKPAAAAPPGASPPNTIPPRVSPPRPDARPRADKHDGGTPKRTAPRRAAPQPMDTDTEAMRLAREMAGRHHLEIRGFETSGIGEHTVREIAGALDAVLGRYTLRLRGIEIIEGAGAAYRVENRSATTESVTPGPWIVLDRAIAANPAQAAGTADPAPRAADVAHAERPMCAMFTRALGGVLDLVGGCRARAEAQRTLITEYLRVHGAKGDTLARVVGGYKLWRSTLSDNSFRHGVFAPETALTEAFAAVELDGAAVCEPAKTLHRLLLMAAKASPADE